MSLIKKTYSVSLPMLKEKKLTHSQSNAVVKRKESFEDKTELWTISSLAFVWILVATDNLSVHFSSDRSRLELRLLSSGGACAGLMSFLHGQLYSFSKSSIGNPVFATRSFWRVLLVDER
ncbi:hypothetical protein M378DRAFT_911470 [Amanita muscaria Koide BX008]|uniref:Uncharacterized protein n=1 Tax=Amanita muscaria (strain Koide BX008) TaxID=946122 RepID=A0A0C2WVA9_AMAMK|nr:hypothetical protein M378DRAFT_911470 [Amanita muscaria Koide BX008]